jgi:hypothetical protein
MIPCELVTGSGSKFGFSIHASMAGGPFLLNVVIGLVVDGLQIFFNWQLKLIAQQ